MKKFTAPGMWDYLTDMSDFTGKSLPHYVDDPFSEDQLSRLDEIISELLQRKPDYYKLPHEEQYRGKNWYDPKKVVHLSREMVEFDCPKDIEETMDQFAKPLHSKELRMAHYSYIDYDPRHGDGRYAPALPPHIDNSEDLVTFNYMIDGNIDWDLYVDGTRYTLRKGQAILFSALNMPHFRPKRKWKSGEFVKILSVNYSPLTDFRFTGETYPLDPVKYPDQQQEYLKAVNEHPKMQETWQLYNQLGLEEGIPADVHGLLIDEKAS